MWIIELEMCLFKVANDINIQMKYDTAFSLNWFKLDTI